jgi:hypothetical protein
MEYVLIWAVGVAITLAISYAVIRSAVRAALFDHYKTVHLYEETGVWAPSDDSWRIAPRTIDATETADAPLKWWQR